MLVDDQFWTFVVWLNLALPCCAFVSFIYPGDKDRDLTFNYIDTVYFTWTSSINEPWMNLWCAPAPGERQSRTYVYHKQVTSNGSNPRSFPYNNYNERGLCHMQVETFTEDEWANTPTFNLTSDDSVRPRTWGLAALTEAGGSADPSRIQSLPSIPSNLVITAASTTSLSLLSSFLSASPTASSSSPSEPIASAPTTTPPTPQPSRSSSSNKQAAFTPAAKAGISIGAIFSFLVIVLILILVRLWWSRRQRQRADPHQQESSRESSSFAAHGAAEVGGEMNGRYEFDGEGIPIELLGRPRAELSGDAGVARESVYLR